MTDREAESFPPEVARELRYYVYRLIDPRNGETFYVGKGKGDRVFAHARAEAALQCDEEDFKLQRIRQIRLAGFEVAHVIHRHGMDEATSFEVEAALHDAYPGLTNLIAPPGSDRGAMHAREVITRYIADEAVFGHKALLISINRTAAERSIYDATRYAWKLDKKKATQAELVLATVQGLIVAAFVPREWLEATEANFPGRADPGGAPGRLGFVGEEAPEGLRMLYVRKRVPDEYRKRGAANPIKYTW